MSQPSRKKRRTDERPNLNREPVVTDTRFANIQSDPRYRLPGKRQRVKVDKRFARALEDEDFSRRSRVDRYGRPLETDAERKRLKRKYEFEDEKNTSDEEVSDGADDDEEVQRELQRVEKTFDPLREGKDIDTSSDDSSSDEDSDDLEEYEDSNVQAEPEDVPVGEVTSRIAVVNLDWDNIRAEDLMAVFNSFLPSFGRLLKASIYPSEFGRERMEKEELEGPPTEVFARSDKREIDSEAGSENGEDEEDIKASLMKPDDGSEFDSSALRQYQLERLRYFYAVLEFSSPNVAKAVYDAVDGTEYLSTANLFDLRFVPDETDFSTDRAREQCQYLPNGYRPNEFVTDALQHSKVRLTWDADDKGRKDATTRAFRGSRKDIDENDLKAYLGSDSSGDEEDLKVEGDDEKTISSTATSKKEAERQKMRALLGLAPEPAKKSKKDSDAPVGGVQITFSSGLSGPAAEKDKTRSVFENSPEPNETTVERYKRKERERKQKRKEKMKQGVSANVTEATSTEVGQSKINAQVPPETAVDEDGEEDLGFDDPFFAAPSAIDTKTSSNKIRKEERLRKKKEREAEEEADRKQRAELELLMSGEASTTSKTQKPSMRHFDMKEIEKAEKRAEKLARKKNGKTTDRATGDKQDQNDVDDTFKLNTTDPRFARLFENHEYAIDPTNPRYKGTKGMKALLNEARTRKTKGDGSIEEHHGVGSSGKKASSQKSGRSKDMPIEGEAGITAVRNLTEKIKSKIKERN